jgi:hypothetical protein
MNKIAIAFALILLSTVPAFAAGYEGNPDRYTSFGANLVFGSGTGTYTATSSGISAEQNLTASTGSLLLDVKVPTSDTVTFNAGLAFSGNQFKGDATPVFASSDQKLNSFSIELGFRMYMH